MEDIDMKDIGCLLFRYRVEHRVTQEKFAELSGLSRLTVNQIENSRNGKIQAGTLSKIMTVINKYQTQGKTCKEGM